MANEKVVERARAFLKDRDAEAKAKAAAVSGGGKKQKNGTGGADSSSSSSNNNNNDVGYEGGSIDTASEADIRRGLGLLLAAKGDEVLQKNITETQRARDN
jgi:hypothetical protein